MTYDAFMDVYDENMRSFMENRTVRVDVSDSVSDMVDKIESRIKNQKFGTFYVAICDGEQLKDNLEVLETEELGSGKNLDAYPLEDSDFPILQNVDISFMARTVCEEYGLQSVKHGNRVAQAEALCDGIVSESGFDFEK